MRNVVAIPHRLLAVALAGALCAAAIGPAQASRPVHKTVIGCVTDGVLIGDTGYSYRVRHAEDRSDVDLTPYEGRHIRYDGALLPGDVFYVRTEPADLGPCPAKDNASP